MSASLTEHAPRELGELERLEDVLDRETLADVCRSFHDLFGLSVRVLSRDGEVLADVHEEQPLCRLVNGTMGGRVACVDTVEAVRSAPPGPEPVLHRCFTGAHYQVAPIHYQGRQVARFVIGPYLPAELKSAPRSLLEVDPAIDPAECERFLASTPRVRAATAERVSAHLRQMIELLLFASHRAQLMSEMHVASIRESHRELAEKTSKLQAAYDRLRELDRLKSNFLATVSHELRTPLTAIIGYSEMLEAGIAGELVGEQQQFVQTIHQKGDHLLRLITSLLDLGKLEQGTLTLRSEALQVGPLLREIAATVEPVARKKSITVEVSLADDVPKLAGDPIRLRQILQNLTDNAVKFTPTGGTVHLHARAAELDSGLSGRGAALMGSPRHAVAFSVRDSGVGMETKELSRIFDAFYQVDGSATREHGGVGLGLSIVKRLVDAHEGELHVDSAPGRGTTFTVTLPELSEPR